MFILAGGFGNKKKELQERKDKMKIAKGTRVKIDHKRKGEFIGILTSDYDDNDLMWLKLETQVSGMSENWEAGDLITVKKSLCKAIDIITE